MKESQFKYLKTRLRQLEMTISTCKMYLNDDNPEKREAARYFIKVLTKRAVALEKEMKEMAKNVP